MEHDSERDRPAPKLPFGHLLRGARRVLADPFDTSALPVFLRLLGKTPIYRWPYARMLRGLTAAEIEALRALTVEPIPFDWLATLDPESFGYHYRSWILSAGLRWDFYLRLPIGDDWRYMRFAKIHDFHHTLFGLDGAPPAEVFLQAFDAVNFGEPAGIATMLALPLLARRHGRPRALVRHALAGARAGRALPNLYVFRFEDHYETPLVELRRRCRIPARGLAPT